MLVFTPNASLPITEATRSNSFCWVAFCGFLASSNFRSGTGSARLFTFWFCVIGILSICIVTAGTIYGGFSARINSFSASTETGWSETT